MASVVKEDAVELLLYHGADSNIPFKVIKLSYTGRYYVGFISLNCCRQLLIISTILYKKKSRILEFEEMKMCLLL